MTKLPVAWARSEGIAPGQLQTARPPKKNRNRNRGEENIGLTLRQRFSALLLPPCRGFAPGCVTAKSAANRRQFPAKTDASPRLHPRKLAFTENESQS